MIDRSSTDSLPDTIHWRRTAATEVANPLVQRLPYLELKLQHCGIEPMAFAEGFFPDAVPYELDGDNRVFYWRPVLEESGLKPTSWSGIYATTDSLSGASGAAADTVDLVNPRDEATEVVIDGTIAGESTLALLSSYRAPEVVIGEMNGDRVALSVGGQEYIVPAGTRREIQLPERNAVLATEDAKSVTVTPELIVRFPGERTLYHPAPGAECHLFPSFGLDLQEVSTRIDIPTASGDLDHEAMAGTFGVDLSTRPYPERVLWQAFVFTAFDLAAETAPRIAQFDNGLIATLDHQS